MMFLFDDKYIVEKKKKTQVKGNFKRQTGPNRVCPPGKYF